MSNKIIQGIIQFSGFTLDTESHVLTRFGREKRLEPKVVALLCYLIANRNQVVSREQIAETVWPGVVVGDDAITRTIFALRNALADDAKRPQFIETIPKKGYRFVAELEPLKQENTSKSWAWLVIPVLLVLGVAVLWVGSRYVSQASTLSLGVMQSYTRHVGVEAELAINSSAQKMLYVHTHAGQSSLYLANMTKDKSRKLELEGHRLFSPIWIDDYSFVYLRQMNDEYQLVKYTAQNKEEVLYRSENKLSDPVYFPGAEPLIILVERESHRNTVLKSVNLINGRAEQFLEGGEALPLRLYHPLLSSDQKYLFLVALDAWQPEIFKVEIETRKVQSLSRDFDRIRGLSWGPNEQLLVSGVKDVSEGLWLLSPEQNASPQNLFRATLGEQIRGAEWDPSSKAIYFENFNINTNALAYTSSTQSINALDALNSEGVEKSSRFSKDGGYIYYCSDRSGFFDVWRYDLRKQQNQRISNMNSLGCSRLLLSHDESKIALVIRKGHLEFIILDIDSGAVLKSTVLDELLVPMAWSHDDKNIYASTLFESKLDLYRFDALSFEQQSHWSGAGMFAAEDAEGKYVYYLKTDKLIKESLDTGEQEVAIATLNDMDLMYPAQIKLVDQALHTAYLDEHTIYQVEYPLDSTKEPVSKLDSLEGFGHDTFWLDSVDENFEFFLLRERKSNQGNIIKVDLE